MIETIRHGFSETGAKNLYFERFSAPPVVDGSPFEVELARTGEVVGVGADETLLQALVKVRPDVAYSCRQGFCGTCKVDVLAGTPEHRDNRLTDGERQSSMLACVSRSVTPRLVLDV